ncbi:hypothetical protein VSK92_21575 [Bacillus swezeyi]
MVQKWLNDSIWQLKSINIEQAKSMFFEMEENKNVLVYFSLLEKRCQLILCCGR